MSGDKKMPTFFVELLKKDDEELLDYAEYFPIVFEKPELKKRFIKISKTLKEFAEGDLQKTFRIISRWPSLLKTYQYGIIEFQWLVNRFVDTIKHRNITGYTDSLKKSFKAFQLGHRPEGTMDYLQTEWLVRLYQHNEINAKDKLVREYGSSEVLSQNRAIEKVAEKKLPTLDLDDAKRHIKRHLAKAEAFRKKLGIPEDT